MIDVINLQRKIKLDTAPIRAFVADLPDLIEECAGGTFSVAFISDDRMRKLNHTFRNKDTTTDVLSFPNEPDDFTSSPPYEEAVDAASADGVVLSSEPVTSHLSLVTFLGDIVISAEQAGKQAAENGLSLDAEIKQLILHGVLHLCGYDHEIDNGEMNEREIELRDRIGIA